MRDLPFNRSLSSSLSSIRWMIWSYDHVTCIVTKTTISSSGRHETLYYAERSPTSGLCFSVGCVRWRAIGYVGGAVWRSTGHGTRTTDVHPLHGSTVRHHRATSGQRSSILDACLVGVEAWLKASRLRLNPSKTHVMWLGSAQQLAKVWLNDIPVLSSQLTVVDTARNLGVVVHRQLSMSAHVAAVCRDVYYQLRQLRPLKRCMTDKTVETLTHAYMNTLTYLLTYVLISRYKFWYKFSIKRFDDNLFMFTDHGTLLLVLRYEFTYSLIRRSHMPRCADCCMRDIPGNATSLHAC